MQRQRVRRRGAALVLVLATLAAALGLGASPAASHNQHAPVPATPASHLLQKCVWWSSGITGVMWIGNTYYPPLWWTRISHTTDNIYSVDGVYGRNNTIHTEYKGRLGMTMWDMGNGHGGPVPTWTQKIWWEGAPEPIHAYLWRPVHYDGADGLVTGSQGNFAANTTSCNGYWGSAAGVPRATKPFWMP